MKLDLLESLLLELQIHVKISTLNLKDAGRIDPAKTGLLLVAVLDSSCYHL